MKKILLFVLLIPFLSCKNKKAELVDLQKKYTDSVEFYTRVWKRNAIENLNNNLSVKESVGQGRRDNLVVQKFKHLVDSLEWELKKGSVR
jgi:hypothetical protein